MTDALDAGNSRPAAVSRGSKKLYTLGNHPVKR
jgi:hypothetical protein